MDRYKFFDIDITSLEVPKSRSNRFSLFQSRFYAIVSIATPTSRASRGSLLGTSLGNRSHAWKDNCMRFEAKESNFCYDYPMLVIQIRRRRAFCNDKDVGEPFIVPLIELFENAQNDKFTRSNSAVVRVRSKNKPKLGFLYFSYGFSNKLTTKREVKNNGGSSRGDKEGVSTMAVATLLQMPVPALGSNSTSLRRFRDTNQNYYRLQDINDAVYQLLFFS